MARVPQAIVSQPGHLDVATDISVLPKLGAPQGERHNLFHPGVPVLTVMGTQSKLDICIPDENQAPT